MRKCEMCGDGFVPRVDHQVVCGKTCAKQKAKKLYRDKNPEKAATEHLNTGTIGAMHEMIVCADLLRRGFEVFRAVSPSSPFDMAAFRNGKLLRIEVTTGSYSTTGAMIHPTKDFSRFDLLAIVTHGGDILYKPEPLPEDQK